MLGPTLPAGAPEWTRLLALCAQLLLAAVVTAHALLHKSDVRAALGWIGATWLSPIAGGLLYYLFGINRITRRAVHFDELRRPPHSAIGVVSTPACSPGIATLADIGLKVTGTPLLDGTEVKILHGGDQAYPAMLAAIRSATRSVALASYIFRPDPVGFAFVAALIDATRRGVEVRVLIDGVGGGYVLPRVLRALQAGQVRVARFLHTWVPWRMPFLNMRNHKKLLVIDGAVSFTGGLNIGVANTSCPTRRRRIDDTHVRVAGPVVRQLMQTFAEDWSFATGEVLDGTAWWPPLRAAGAVSARGIRSGPDADIDKLETILGAALAQAQRRVRIVTPYFLPDQRLQFGIAQAILRGVTVEIVVPERSDYFFMDWAMRAQLRFFPDACGALHLSRGPFDHSKIMTVDGEWALIGSSNWDARSLRLNFEFDLECYDQGVAAQLDALVEEKIGRSRRLSHGELAAAPISAQLRETAARLLLPYL